MQQSIWVAHRPIHGKWHGWKCASRYLYSWNLLFLYLCCAFWNFSIMNCSAHTSNFAEIFIVQIFPARLLPLLLVMAMMTTCHSKSLSRVLLCHFQIMTKWKWPLYIHMPWILMNMIMCAKDVGWVAPAAVLKHRILLLHLCLCTVKSMVNF